MSLAVIDNLPSPHGSNKSELNKLLSSLSDEQRKIVLSDSPYIRVVAAAGTGKTETMTRKLVRLIAEGAYPHKIIAFTFTEKAAEEMKQRIYERVEKILGLEMCANLGDLFVGTIHSFCLRVLQDHFGYGNHDILDENQEMAFILRHGWNMGFDRKRYSENCLSFPESVNVFYDELINRAKLEQMNPDFSRKLKQYEDLMDINRILTYSRIIRLAVEKLREDSFPLTESRFLAVDEYQDINKAQEALIRIIAARRQCYVVGDPRQCIYEWRGSDPACFTRFAKERRCETFPLTVNRRSTQPIISAANILATHFGDAELKAPMRSWRIDEGMIICIEVESPTKEARWIASQVKQLVKVEICKYSDIAVLLRSVRTSSVEIINAFRELEIPFLVSGKVGLFQREEVQAVARIFAWCADDGFWRLDEYDWSKLITGDDLLDYALEKLWPLKDVLKNDLKEFRLLIRAGKYKHFTGAYQDLLNRLHFERFNPDIPDQATALANLGRFNVLLTDYESSKRRGGQRAEWLHDLKSLCWYMNTYALGAYEQQPAEDIWGINAVTLSTVHQAKGLEWPIVFLPALTSKRFPSSRAGSPREWLLSRDLFDAKRYEGGINDERRLFYVALTRARDTLCLSYFRRINNRCFPSQFVLECGVSANDPPQRPFINCIHRGIR